MTKHTNTQTRRRPPASGIDCFPMVGIWCFVLPSGLGISDFGFRFAFISPGGSEFILIMLVLILLFGAKDAPRIFRTLHTLLDKVQRTAASFRYRIMYGDLYGDSGTTQEKPYDVEGHETENGDQAAGDREQEAESPAADQPNPETQN